MESHLVWQTWPWGAEGQCLDYRPSNPSSRYVSLLLSWHTPMNISQVRRDFPHIWPLSYVLQAHAAKSKLGMETASYQPPSAFCSGNENPSGGCFWPTHYRSTPLLSISVLGDINTAVKPGLDHFLWLQSHQNTKSLWRYSLLFLQPGSTQCFLFPFPVFSILCVPIHADLTVAPWGTKHDMLKAGEQGEDQRP